MKKQDRKKAVLLNQEKDIALIQKAVLRGFPVYKHLVAMKAAQSTSSFKRIFVNACRIINYYVKLKKK